MKKTLLLLIILLNISFVYAQNIDDLQTFRKTAKFLKKNVNKEYNFKEVFDREREIDEEDFNDFVTKIDINNDGLTDLIVDAYLPLIIVINEGQKKFKELKFRNREISSQNESELDTITKIGNEIIFVFETEIHEFDDDTYPNVKIKKDQKVLSYDRPNEDWIWIVRDVSFKLDSLVVKHGELVEYKKSEPNLKRKIKQVEFSTSGCYGSCPIFELKITADRIIEYNGKRFTNFIGSKTAKLESKNFKDLIGLLEYSDLQNVKDYFTVNWTDDQTGTLKVTFNDNETKVIQDYGLLGTINLQAIYKKLFEISESIE